MIHTQDADFTLLNCDVLAGLRSLPDGSVHCVVTSPPYWGLRDYGEQGQIGLEATPDEYVARMVQVFREVRRVLRADGTCWLNLGDSYASVPGSQQQGTTSQRKGRSNVRAQVVDRKRVNGDGTAQRPPGVDGLKPKDLVGIPWRVAFALQADGWYLRSDIIWAKPNPMPESVTDRPTKSHEYVFLLSKGPRYFFDQEAVRESVSGNAHPQGRGYGVKAVEPGQRIKNNHSFSSAIHNATTADLPTSRNIRSVWDIATQPYPEAHFATYPEELVRRCVLAGCPEDGTVLDPFAGSGTTCFVARKHGRRSIGIELNPDYCALAARRMQQQSLFAETA